MSDVLQRALDPGVAPRRIVLRHPDDEALDLFEHAATAGPRLRVRPFPKTASICRVNASITAGGYNMARTFGGSRWSAEMWDITGAPQRTDNAASVRLQDLDTI